MNKKAFSFMELMLVIVIVSILAASSIPFMFRYFGGFNEVTQQENIVKSLQEINTVISRKVVLDNEQASIENLNNIISSIAAKNNGSDYELANGIIIKKLDEQSVEKCVYKKDGKTHEIANCLRVTLNGRKNEHQHNLSFIIFPANQ